MTNQWPHHGTATNSATALGLQSTSPVHRVAGSTAEVIRGLLTLAPPFKAAKLLT
jgi:hypothetical protein